MRLAGKTAVISGGATGIGFAACRRFLQEGARVAFCDLKQEDVDEAVHALSGIGLIRGYVADISMPQQLSQMIQSVAEEWGRIDVLVNNAGITSDAQFYKMTDEQFDQVLNVNLKGTWHLTKLVIPYMMEQKYGRIVHASSVSAFNGNFGQVNYAASKAAIIGMTRVQARELGRYGITVNAVAPGSILTDMYQAVPEEVREKKRSGIALRRFGTPEEAASVYLFLASEDAGYVTGQTIVVDGGFN